MDLTIIYIPVGLGPLPRFRGFFISDYFSFEISLLLMLDEINSQDLIYFEVDMAHISSRRETQLPIELVTISEANNGLAALDLKDIDASQGASIDERLDLLDKIPR